MSKYSEILLCDSHDGSEDVSFLWDIFSRPLVSTGVAIAAFVVVVFGGVIRINPPTLNTPSMFSVNHPLMDRNGVGEWWHKSVAQLTLWRKTPKNSVVVCPNILPKISRRLWNFFVEAFLIPKYRKEWGKYKSWNFRCPTRQKEDSRFVRKSVEVDSEGRRILFHATPDKHPHPLSHDHTSCRRVRINVGGNIYETQERTLKRYPDTLLGNAEARLKYFNPSTQEYFFDRNRASFEVILDFYQSGGRFRRPEHISVEVLVDDARFYCLPDSVVDKFLGDEGYSMQKDREQILPSMLLMRKIWLLFDNPQSSVQARLVTTISVFAIILSIVVFCLETVHDIAGWRFHDLDLETGIVVDHVLNPFDFADPFLFTETLCSIWFIVEFVVRFLSSPDKLNFLKHFLNIVDLIAILPYFYHLVAKPAMRNEATEESAYDTKKPQQNRINRPSISFVKLIRLVRVFRIFKLSRYSKGLRILGKTLYASMDELFLLICFVVIGVILFSSAIYFAELGTENNVHFQSIPHGFWWAVITITTVGFGDAVPQSAAGKVVGALCAVAGVLTIALPVPVIVSNFNFFYQQTVTDQDVSSFRINNVANCPYRPMEYGGDDEAGAVDTSNLPRKSRQRRKSKKYRVRRVQQFSSDEEFADLKAKARRNQDPCVENIYVEEPPPPTQLRRSSEIQPDESFLDHIVTLRNSVP